MDAEEEAVVVAAVVVEVEGGAVPVLAVLAVVAVVVVVAVVAADEVTGEVAVEVEAEVEEEVDERSFTAEGVMIFGGFAMVAERVLREERGGGREDGSAEYAVRARGRVEIEDGVDEVEGAGVAREGSLKGGIGEEEEEKAF